jgi:hypothetical protein
MAFGQACGLMALGGMAYEILVPRLMHNLLDSVSVSVLISLTNECVKPTQSVKIIRYSWPQAV